ncbi:Bgt-435 [Blumeria graminis f. sp. tritici]|uniref:ATP synthase subunit 9, mitochondrial n=3 Tax=Blumeria graminis TaxID=34373 RepID=A0A061HS77_BLUGR|nr:ATP synthase protein [Blumeria graminis f. sp. tritici 96224]VCU41009.1 Bgt-435 [Blumeria graminis f. sp. tritici]
MASRVFSPKMASIIAQTSAKSARPAMQIGIKANQRAFSIASSSLRTAPFQAIKRQQASKIISNASLKFAGRQTTRSFNSEIATAMVQVSQNLGMGSAAIGLGGAGIGIGLVFSALLTAVARNPSMRGQLFSYAILGFAFVEAIGLFDLMVAMMCKYV